jgi:TRAP transporter TAXI family solute receptor
MSTHGRAFLCRFSVALVALCGLGAAACETATGASVPVRPVTLFTGPSSGAYYYLGKALADVYNANIPDAHVTAVGNDGPGGAGVNAAAVEAGEADLGFSRSDLAYVAYRNGSTSDPNGHPHLRAMAVLYANAVHVLVRRESGITKLSDIRGKRVQIGDDTGTSSGSLARMVLDSAGLSVQDVQIVPNPRNALSRLRAGEMDVRVFASGYPVGSLDDVGPASGVRMLPLSQDAVDRLRSRFPYFKPAVIPKGTYPGQDDDYQTVGIDGLLLCRDTMPEALVYQMTRSLFEALPDLMRDQPAARLINVGRAPATPVPLHPGAARYYRERDLFR